MNKTKLFITFTILFITVGIAAVATSFAINGSTLLANNPDDFKVYFYSVTSNPIEDAKINIISDTAFSFESTLLEVGDYVQIDFGIINSSSNYDADVSMSCTGGNDYVSLDYTLHNNIVFANSDGQGIIYASLVKSYAGEESFDHYIYCELNATAIERDSLKVNDVPPALVKTFNVGDEITLGTEKFNIIRDNGDGTVTMLSKYNVGEDNRQTTKFYGVSFSDKIGWEYQPGPKEIDVQVWGGQSKIVLNNYVSFLQSYVNDDTIVGDLITLKELESLGCVIPADYSYPSVTYRSCYESPYIEWLVNGQQWWIRSARSSSNDRPWVLNDEDNYLYSNIYSNKNAVRPIITISKETIVEFEKLRMYNIGDVVTIGDEHFNVISDNGTTVSMLAKYNLGTDYRQSSTKNYVSFSVTNGWEYTPGPKEVDIQKHEGNAKTYINNYKSFLQSQLNYDFVIVDFISLENLNKLDCTIIADYSDGNMCYDSFYKDWLINSQSWWTKSTYSGGPVGIWIVFSEGGIGRNSYYANYGIRPVITIPKEALK